MVLNKFGLIVQKEWKNTSVIRQNVELDEFIIMPDHIHGIIIINRRGVMPYALKNDLNNENMGHVNINNENMDDKNINNENLDNENTDYKNMDHVNDIRAYGNTPLPFMDNVQKNTFIRSPKQTIGSIIRGYKSAVTINVNQIRKTPKAKIWQRNYFERVIRDQKELDRIKFYIRTNPENYKNCRKEII